MSLRTRSAPAPAGLALLLALASAASGAPRDDPPMANGPGKAPLPAAPAPPPELPPGEEGPAAYKYTTDEAIAFFQARVEANPQDSISFRYLGEMHERQARESGDHQGFARAEAALRKSLELFPDSPRAQASLAAVLCSRHKFAEGLELARKVVERTPKDIDARATLGDALLELGRYDEAEAAYAELRKLVPTAPEVMARQANLAELRGRTDGALELLRRAVDAVKDRPATEAAWYRGRLGDLLFDLGRLDEAAAQYAAVPPGTDPHHDATYGLARVRAAQGRDDEALALFEKAVAIGPDIHMLAALGDMHARLGDSAKADAAHRRVEEESPKQAEHGRDLAMFYLDHDRKLDVAVALVEREFAARRDVHTRDALAWGLFKAGRLDEAAGAIDEALKVGTQDARVFYHAGMIHHRLGREDEARRELARALAINPHFSLTQADVARKVLGGLGR